MPSVKIRYFFQFAILAGVAAILALSGCASAPITTLAPVGPQPAGAHEAGEGQGYLKVYSDTDEYNDGDLMYYPHSRYSIYTSDGRRYKWVENHVLQNDEKPQLVPLPAGNYYIIARSELEGIVRVPIMVMGGRTTVVNLERGKNGDLSAVPLSPS